MKNIVIPINSVLTGVSALAFHDILSVEDSMKVQIEMKKGTNPSSYEDEFKVSTQDESTLYVGSNTISGSLRVYSKERLFIELDKFNLTKEQFEEASSNISRTMNKGILQDIYMKLKKKRRGISWDRIKRELTVKDPTVLMALKRLLKEMVYSASKVEIPTLTFLDTEKVIENLPTSNLKASDIEVITSLKKAFEKVIASTSPFNLSFWKDINRDIAKGTTEGAGKFRNSDVRIQGTTYIPKLFKKKDIELFVESIFEIEDKKTMVATFVARSIKAQFFYDGNKRTSLVIGSKLLIDEGVGLIEVIDKFRGVFLELLRDYYEDDGKEQALVEFLRLCIFKDPTEQIANMRAMEQKYL